MLIDATSEKHVTPVDTFGKAWWNTLPDMYSF